MDPYQKGRKLIFESYPLLKTRILTKSGRAPQVIGKFVGTMFKLHKSRSKFTVKVTCLKSMVPLERYGHKEHICQIIYQTPSLLQ